MRRGIVRWVSETTQIITLRVLRGYHPCNRGRDCAKQMLNGSDIASSLCALLRHYRPLMNTRVQNCDQKPILSLSSRPHFATSHRSYASGCTESKGSGANECDEYDSDGIIEEKGDIEHENCGQAVDIQQVERVCKVVEELFASTRNMEATLDQLGVNLCHSHSLVYHVLRRFSHAKKPAFRFFRWAAKQMGFSHNSQTYNMMMSILGGAKQFVPMLELLEEMHNKGCVLTIETFGIVFKAFATGRDMKKVVHIFTLMEKYRFEVDIEKFNFLLDALGQAKLVKEAEMLFKTMRERFPPDAKTYTVLLSGWCKVKNLTEAGKLWNEMVDQGIKPDLPTHNVMLEGLCKGRKKCEALNLFELMKTSGPSPNSRSYSIVISILCKLHEMEEAFKFFVEMQEHGCPLDAAVYICLIMGYGTAKQFDQAHELLQEMKDKGISHDYRIYNALIKIMVNHLKPDEATKLFDEMIKCCFEPTIHTYNMLMKLYFSTKKSEMGFAIWNQMVQNGCSPDVDSYTVFIGGLIREGRSQEACSIIVSMVEKGMKAPHFDYNKFFADFSVAGQPDIFEELAQKMKFAGKFNIANMFIKFSQKMKKRFKRKHHCL